MTLSHLDAGGKTPGPSPVRAGPDYSIPYRGSPAIGEPVMFDRPHDGIPGGIVVGTLAAPLGTLLVVEVDPGRTVDMHWQRCVSVGPA